VFFSKAFILIVIINKHIFMTYLNLPFLFVQKLVLFSQENPLLPEPSVFPITNCCYILAEIQKFVEIRKETDENSTTYQSETEWSSSPHPDESVEELSENIKVLESKLEEATILINGQNSKILELDALRQKQPQDSAACNNDLLSLQSEVDQLFLEKMETEIQCFILTRASQDWKALTQDQFALYEAQKFLTGDHKSLETKLRHTENRAMMLEEMVDKLESQCKELSETSEVLKLQARASRASLFCSIQFVLLCIAMGTLLVRFMPSSPEIVPT
jgi:hypothetical protein